jgi:hypothetical protein
LSKTSDYQVAPHESDVRGWTVVSKDGEKIGKVDDLLIDPGRMKVAEFEVNVKEGDQFYVPAAEVRIDSTRREVCLTRYAPGEYGTTASAGRTGTDADERLTRTEEELRVGKRAVEAGEVAVAKHVETEHKQVPVNVKREEIVIERRPVNREAAATDVRDDSRATRGGRGPRR